MRFTSGPAEEGSEGRAEDRKDEEAGGCGDGGAGGDRDEAGEREGVTGHDATPHALRSGYSPLICFTESVTCGRMWVMYVSSDIGSICVMLQILGSPILYVVLT